MSSCSQCSGPPGKLTRDITQQAMSGHGKHNELPNEGQTSMTTTSCFPLPCFLWCSFMPFTWKFWSYSSEIPQVLSVCLSNSAYLPTCFLSTKGLPPSLLMNLWPLQPSVLPLCPLLCINSQLLNIVRDMTVLDVLWISVYS